MASTTHIAILGASGYTGSELIRLLLPHPSVRLVALTAEKNAGQPIGAVLPHLADLGLPDLCALDAVDFSRVDFVFCALPHGVTQEVVARLPESLRVVDLSADFRLADPAVYERWYGHAHRAVALQKQAVYGLTEVNRAAIRAARLVANPGCYPTAALLPLAPLLRAKLIEPSGIIIDAKSGASGAGRDLRLGNMFSEVAEGFQAYGVGHHRHMPEIDQGLAEAFGGPVPMSFTPHLVPMNRGIFETIYVRMAPGRTVADLREAWRTAYAGEPFVKILAPDQRPSTRLVCGTNVCQMAVVEDRAPDRAILLSAIDNLVKGASGQAVQNMNLMLGFPETTGLATLPVFP